MKNALAIIGAALVFILSISFQNCSEGFRADSSANSGFAKSLGGANLIAASTAAPTGYAPALSGNDIYSSSFIIQGGTLVMYFGGWYLDGETHDTIYRSACHPGLSICDAPYALIDTVASGFNLLNDPVVLYMPAGYYIMYMTGVTAPSNVVETDNSTYYATSWDGITWSKPALLEADIWVPAATLAPNGDVLLYGNTTSGASVVQYNMGPSGVSPTSRIAINAPNFYINVAVQYQASLGAYEMLGELLGSDPNQIDFLVSKDGINWSIAQSAVVRPQGANIHVRTPAFDPADPNMIYFAQTTDPEGEHNQIWSTRLDTSLDAIAAAALQGVAATPIATPVPPPPACVASSADQNYLTTAVQFFNGAAGTAGASQAATCNSNLQASLTNLGAQNWPCAATATTLQHVQTCVGLVTALANHTAAPTTPPPATTAPPPATVAPPVACQAPAATQNYLTTAMSYLSTARQVASVGSLASQCYNAASPAVNTLQSQGWPCGTAVDETMDYVSTCVGSIKSTLGQ